MHRTRWYPSLIGLEDGTLLCMGGRDDERAPELTPELFNPTTGTWDLLTGATSEEAFGEGGWSYPRSFLAPNGKAFVMPNKRRRAYYLSPEGNGSIEQAVDFSSTVSTNRHLAVMYRQHKLLNLRDEDASILTLRANGDISIKDVADLATKRFWSEGVILANGEVMVTGGSTVSQDRDTACLLYTSPSPRDRG